MSVSAMASSFLVLAFLRANYSLAVAGVSIFVLAQLALIDDPLGTLAPERIIDTLIASAVILLAMIVVPPPSRRAPVKAKKSPR